MSGIVTTNAPFPPFSTQIGDEQSGTISNISCVGPCTAVVYSAAGVALHSINAQQSVNEAVSISYSGGPAYVVQKTPGSISISIT